MGTRLISIIIQDGGHVKFPTLGICRTIKILTVRTDLTVEAAWVARPPSGPRSSF